MNRILVTGGSGFIGTNLLEQLVKEKYAIMNIDIAPPNLFSHREYWRCCNILDHEELNKCVQQFQPDSVIHLAARTDTSDRLKLEDYRVNVEGTRNLLACMISSKSIRRFILTSTQFVHQHHGLPANDEEFFPCTAYGESKVLTEQMIRNARIDCTWTIIRPTNIWGPWHPRYPKEFWFVLRKGRYLHPGRRPVIRSYGYVGNVVAQIMAILTASPEKVHSKVYYVGDEPLNLYDWVNGFSEKLTGKNVRVVPRILIKMVASLGDILKQAKIGFPLTSSRFQNMVCDNVAPMEKTIQDFGRPPFSMEDGISKTVEWLTTQDSVLRSIK